MTTKITRGGFLAIAVVGAGVLIGGGKFASSFLGKPTETHSAVPQTTQLQHFSASTSAPTYTLPVTAAKANLPNCPTMEILAWQATGGLDLANGGSTTAPGSDVAKYTGGGCLNLKRQDDYGPMEANMAKFIASNGSEGDAFFAIMGDGYPYVAAALNKLIPAQFAAFGVIGFSDGEDKCMMPVAVQHDPQAAKGVLIAAVPRDGDWDICVKWASDNGIKINTDQKTYDPDAINFMDVDAFTTADEKLISQACETRLVVSNGLSHGTKKVCVNGVATWTPGDVDVATKYPGSIVGVASTHDYAGQMPALLIGVKSWMKDHHDYVVGLLKAADRGAQTIRTSSNGLYTMGQVHTQIFGEQTPEYWVKYFHSVDGTDQKGDVVKLGGSSVITLEEERDYFGMRAGTENIYASVYRVFKGYDETFYPDLFSKAGNNGIPGYDDVVDTSYLADALKDIPQTTGVVATVAAANLTTSAPITQTVSKKSWHIEFDSGKATIRSDSMDQLYAIEDTAAMTGLRIRLDGYTDNTGSMSVNVPLSEARAQAVADWLNKKAPANFPLSRMEARGHGPSDPVCEGNGTAECKAQNRRVEITLGS